MAYMLYLPVPQRKAAYVQKLYSPVAQVWTMITFTTKIAFITVSRSPICPSQ